MDKESLLLKAMNYQYPEEIPVGSFILPAAWLKHPREIRELVKRFPQFFGEIGDNYLPSIPDSYHTGNFTDEWGCEWSNIEEGMESIVTGHPIKNREDIAKVQIPPNRDGRLPHGFMYLRILDLRGFEEAMIDFAEECDEIQDLIDKVVEYNLIQIDAALPHTGNIMRFGDDLGMQKGLAIGPVKWRRYFKPAFKQMYDKVHAAGKAVYMHTDGMIYEIIPDLFECGVNMVNPQFRANGLDNLVRVCKGKYPINLDLDRQAFPCMTPKECGEHVRQCVEALYLPSGGLSLDLEIGMDVPLDNMEALLVAADKYRHYKG